MDEYNMVANETRNLEQEYIGRVFAVHNEQIRTLKRTIAELEQRGDPAEDGDGAVEDLRGQLQALEAENKRGREELKRLKKEHCDEIERIGARLREDGGAPGRAEALEEENSRLQALVDKWKMAEGRPGLRRGAGDQDPAGEAAPDPPFVAGISDKQDQILQSVRELARLREDYKTRIDALEAVVEKHKANEEKLEENIYKLRSMHGGEDVTMLKQRIAALERENNQHVRDKYTHDKNEKLLNEQKDTIVLLQDSIASKDKAIERLTAQVERLKKAGELSGGENPADVLKPQRAVVGALDTAKPKPNPHESIDDQHKKARRQAKPRAASSKPDASKLVSVENLIKEDNKSFFNNLSFTNSSPMPDKKTKKK